MVISTALISNNDQKTIIISIKKLKQGEFIFPNKKVNIISKIIGIQ